MQIQLPVDSVWIWLLVRGIVCKWLFQIPKKGGDSVHRFSRKWTVPKFVDFFVIFWKKISSEQGYTIRFLKFCLKNEKSRNHQSSLHIRLFCNIYKNNHQELFWYLKPLFIGSSTHLQPHSYHTRKELELSSNLKNVNC